MTMKFFLFSFFSFIILLCAASLTSASGFSPTSLIYETSMNEESCQTVHINSESEKIMVSDGWAAHYSEEWSVNGFTTPSINHGLTLTYDKELTKDERSVAVCLTAKTAGEYHGVLLLREEQEGNSVVQMGVWLKAIIKNSDGKVPAIIAAPKAQVNLSSEKISAEKKADEKIFDEASTVKNEIEKNARQLSESGNSPLTANVIADENIFTKNIWVIAVFIVGILIGIIVMSQRRSRDEFNV
ncbi:MAG: hypothetical protein AABX16_03540 [Nanoarchaeota archaeon]